MLLARLALGTLSGYEQTAHQNTAHVRAVPASGAARAHTYVSTVSSTHPACLPQMMYVFHQKVGTLAEELRFVQFAHGARSLQEQVRCGTRTASKAGANTRA